VIPNHGLSKGDWIRNNSRLWEVRQVKKVIDKDTFEVDEIQKQRKADEIELYKAFGIIKSVK
jgi:hypothetical protein